MTPKEKAENLVQRYMSPDIGYFDVDFSVKLAVIAVDEIINVAWWSSTAILKEPYRISQKEYWQEVKEELQKL